MKNRIFCLLLALVMLFGTVALTLTSCGEEPPAACTNHVDNDGDGVCDTEGCNEPVAPEACTNHVDSTNDAYCDNCGAEILVGNFEWNSELLRFALNMNSHGGELGSGLKRYLAGGNSDGSDLVKEVSKRNLKAAMFTKTTMNYDYWSDGNKDLDITDGDNKELHAWGTSQNYIYQLLDGGSDQPDMYSTFLNGLVNAQVNRAFANLLTTKQGSNHFRFANDADYGETVGDSEGYMMSIMESLTLSKNKMYLIASDYFIDVVRAFFIVPVNVAFMNEIGQKYKTLNGNVLPAEGPFKDRDGDGEFTIDDFVQLVWDREWNYEAMAQYAEVAYEDSDGDGKQSVKDRYGFVMEIGSGFSASGIIYASSLAVITRVPDGNGGYKYNYPGIVYDEATQSYGFSDTASDVDLANELFTFDGALTRLFKTTGLFVSDNLFTKAASNPNNLYRPNNEKDLLCIMNKFCASTNEILFGGYTMTGNIDLVKEGENNDYQDMRKEGAAGLAIVPGPMYRPLADNEQYTDATAANYLDYNTHIHSIARLGAISVNTKKFSQCSAFLDYQSTHSKSILDEYYKEKLVRAAGSENDNAKIMEFLRGHVRTVFAAAFECILDVKYGTATVGQKMQVIIKGANRNLQPDGYVITQYKDIAAKKQAKLDELAAEWDTYPELNYPTN